ncbi:MAG TPA: rhomboid family intramembrane serine protease [Candidatus Obscuribacterales bacterium]
MIILSDDVENNEIPIVNIFLITANVLIFFLWGLSASSEYYRHWGYTPYAFLSQHNIQQFCLLFSSMFVHAGFFHLLGNMWVLYLFGDNVEEELGHFTYLIFYLACGILAACAHMYSDPSSILPCVGASGAISGVMGAYIILHPHATCKTWWGDDSLLFAFRTFRIPAVLVIGGWFCLQVLLSSLIPVSVAHIAFFAHIGGFIAGLVLVMLVRGKTGNPSKYGKRNDLEFYNGPTHAVMLLAFVALCLFLGNPILHGKAAPSAVSQQQTANAPTAKPITKKSPSGTHRSGHQRRTRRSVFRL